MNTFDLEIWDDESSLCTFYSVKQEGSVHNETDKFFTKYETGFETAVQELMSFVLDVIGEDHGAADALFNRYENQVTGLPAKGKLTLNGITIHYPGFPLRLYALKITEEIVILFNGGVKDGSSNQDSSLNLKWMEACQFAIRIQEALQSGEILVSHNKRKLTNHLGGDEIIL